MGFSLACSLTLTHLLEEHNGAQEQKYAAAEGRDSCSKHTVSDDCQCLAHFQVRGRSLAVHKRVSDVQAVVAAHSNEDCNRKGLHRSQRPLANRHHEPQQREHDEEMHRVVMVAM